jgi:hypothetical protein
MPEDNVIDITQILLDRRKKEEARKTSEYLKGVFQITEHLLFKKEVPPDEQDHT